MTAHHHDHEHEHGPGRHHGHEHGYGPAVLTPPERPGRELDPANQALAEALRISFVVLKLVMAVVVLLFFASGIFHVQENEQAVVLRFGKVAGAGSERILGPGLHWSLPYPIEEIIKIPGKNTIRQLELRNFWYFETPRQRAKLDPPSYENTLQFIRDGYALTASRSVMPALAGTAPAADVGEDDYNIMHSLWSVHYRIADPVPFIEQLWDGTEAGWAQVETLLRNVLSEAVIRVSAVHDIDWLIWEAPQRFGHEVELIMKAELERLGVGIEIRELVLTDKVPPRQVKIAFEAVTTAGQTAGSMVTIAQTGAHSTISEAKARANIILADAQAYQKRVVDETKADANVLSTLLAKIDQAVREKFPGSGPEVARLRAREAGGIRDIFIDQFYQEMLRNVLAAAGEIFVPGANSKGEMEWWTYLSRNPKIGAAPKPAAAPGFAPMPAPTSTPPMP